MSRFENNIRDPEPGDKPKKPNALFNAIGHTTWGGAIDDLQVSKRLSQLHHFTRGKGNQNKKRQEDLDARTNADGSETDPEEARKKLYSINEDLEDERSAQIASEYKRFKVDDYSPQPQFNTMMFQINLNRDRLREALRAQGREGVELSALQDKYLEKNAGEERGLSEWYQWNDKLTKGLYKKFGRKFNTTDRNGAVNGSTSPADLDRVYEEQKRQIEIEYSDKYGRYNPDPKERALTEEALDQAYAQKLIDFAREAKGAGENVTEEQKITEKQMLFVARDLVKNARESTIQQLFIRQQGYKDIDDAARRTGGKISDWKSDRPVSIDDVLNAGEKDELSDEDKDKRLKSAQKEWDDEQWKLDPLSQSRQNTWLYANKDAVEGAGQGLYAGAAQIGEMTYAMSKDVVGSGVFGHSFFGAVRSAGNMNWAAAGGALAVPALRAFGAYKSKSPEAFVQMREAVEAAKVTNFDLQKNLRRPKDVEAARDNLMKVMEGLQLNHSDTEKKTQMAEPGSQHGKERLWRRVGYIAETAVAAGTYLYTGLPAFAAVTAVMMGVRAGRSLFENEKDPLRAGLEAASQLPMDPTADLRKMWSERKDQVIPPQRVDPPRVEMAEEPESEPATEAVEQQPAAEESQPTGPDIYDIPELKAFRSSHSGLKGHYRDIHNAFEKDWQPDEEKIILYAENIKDVQSYLENQKTSDPSQDKRRFKLIIRDQNLVEEGDGANADARRSLFEGQIRGAWQGAGGSVDIRDIKVIPRGDISDYLSLLLGAKVAGSDLTVTKVLANGVGLDMEAAVIEPSASQAGVEPEPNIEPQAEPNPDSAMSIDDMNPEQLAKRKLEIEQSAGGQYKTVLKGLESTVEKGWRPLNRSTGRRLLIHDEDIVGASRDEIIVSMAKKYAKTQLSEYEKVAKKDKDKDKDKDKAQDGGGKKNKGVAPSIFDKFTDIRFVAHVPGLTYAGVNEAEAQLRTDKNDEGLQKAVEQEKNKMRMVVQAFVSDLNKEIKNEFSQRPEISPDQLPASFIPVVSVTALPGYDDVMNPGISNINIEDYLKILGRVGVAAENVKISGSKDSKLKDKSEEKPDPYDWKFADDNQP